jgi:hypothetical protein
MAQIKESSVAKAPQSVEAFADRQWYIVRRWQEYAGEARANLLRIIGIGAFYAVELLNYRGLSLGPIDVPAGVDEQFHKTVTALAVAWLMVALGTLVCLRIHVFPPLLKYATTAADIVLLTTILLVADGARSPLVVGYFLLIVLSSLRFERRLVWCSTLGCIAGYLSVCGYARWMAADRDIGVPRYQQLIVLVALSLTGIALGQVIRRARALAEEYAARLASGGNLR